MSGLVRVPKKVVLSEPLAAHRKMSSSLRHVSLRGLYEGLR